MRSVLHPATAASVLLYVKEKKEEFQSPKFFFFFKSVKGFLQRLFNLSSTLVKVLATRWQQSMTDFIFNVHNKTCWLTLYFIWKQLSTQFYFDRRDCRFALYNRKVAADMRIPLVQEIQKLPPHIKPRKYKNRLPLENTTLQSKGMWHTPSIH